MNGSNLFRNVILVPTILATLWKFFAKTKSKPAKDFTLLTTVKKLNLQRFMGPWYVIAHTPTAAEQGAHNAFKTYSWNVEKKQIDIHFTFNKDSFEGESIDVYRAAFIFNVQTQAEWRTPFYSAKKSSYAIMEIAHNYSYAVAGTPDREHVWILAKKPTMDDDTYNTLKNKIAAQEFNVNLLEKIPQTMLRH